MLTVKSFGKSDDYLKNITKPIDSKKIDEYGEKGLAKIKDATPVMTGKTANSWDVQKNVNRESVELVYTNSNMTKDNIPVVALLVNGHGTKTGGYVPGNDFLKEPVNELIDEIMNDLGGLMNGK